jgi:threonylcarbamoyladenosine tRNA methylthiotransferase MtaB
MAGFHVENFGCRAARADGEAMSGLLRLAGLGERNPEAADVVVVNTCSVTAEADRAARAFIRRAHRLNPAARIVVTGCYAQRAPEELAGLAGVAAVVGNSHKALAPGIAQQFAQVPGHGFTSDGSSIAFAPETAPVGAMPLERHEVSGHDFSRAAQAAKISWALAPEEPIFAPGNEAAAHAGIVSVQSLLTRASAPGRASIWADDRFAHSFLEEAQLAPGAQTRPNLKIQEGCGNRCTFCVIPQTRGSSRSLTAASVLRQVEGFVAAGGSELVLSGINLGRWGRDLPADEWSFLDLRSPALSPERRRKDGAPHVIGGSGLSRPTLAALVRRILETTALPRLRLSSIEPMDWDAELIGLMAEFGGSRLARHAHLPLQSGSDAVLRRMHRRYRPWHYADKVAALTRAAGPDLTLGADVIAGFPGETDREFEETLDFLRALPFGYLHLFPFSPRPGTRAWALHAESPVPPAVLADRMAALRALVADQTRAHRSRFIGRELEAITLHTPAALAQRGRTSALTENFLPVEINAGLPANRMVRVHIHRLNPDMTLEASSRSAGPARYEATSASKPVLY